MNKEVSSHKGELEPYGFSRSWVDFQGHPGPKSVDFGRNRSFPGDNSRLM